MVYHGDVNEDGTLDFADVNPFVALVMAGQCGPAGGGGEMMMYEGGEGYPPGLPSPEEMAAELAANVWPELYDGLLSMIQGAIDTAPNDQTAAYWQAVYAALTQ
jgi:hypothetical protein